MIEQHEESQSFPKFYEYYGGRSDNVVVDLLPRLSGLYRQYHVYGRKIWLDGNGENLSDLVLPEEKMLVAEFINQGSD